jgi:hypothetical protein
MAKMSKIWKEAFKGNRRICAGRPNVLLKTTTGAIASAAPVGTLCYNTFDNQVHICTVATGTWVRIEA